MPLDDKDLEKIGQLFNARHERFMQALDGLLEARLQSMVEPMAALVTSRIEKAFEPKWATIHKRSAEQSIDADLAASKAETRDQEFTALKHQVDELEKKVNH